MTAVSARTASVGGSRPAPGFAVVTGPQVSGVLEGREKEIVDLVEQVYLLHASGQSVNPPSYFLRFPDRPTARIIALPASIGGAVGVAGLKWISSFPENVADGLPRASAVLILNDQITGYPFACLEASVISATRTAAMAASAADWLTRGRGRPARLGFVGTGLIARFIHTYLSGTGWTFDEVGIHDLAASSADGFAGYLRRSGETGRLTVHRSAEDLVRSSDLVVFATVAGTPHILDPTWFDHHPVVLHVSLRDLSPEVLRDSLNVLDDVEHCLKADTSPHLLEQATGSRDFVAGTLAEVMADRLEIPSDRTVVFSPFGLGVLDLGVGKYVYDQLVGSGDLSLVADFFGEVRRHG